MGLTKLFGEIKKREEELSKTTVITIVDGKQVQLKIDTAVIDQAIKDQTPTLSPHMKRKLDPVKKWDGAEERRKLAQYTGK